MKSLEIWKWHGGKASEMQGKRSTKFLLRVLSALFGSDPSITVLRLIAPEILSSPRRWQTPRRGQRAGEEEQGQVLNLSTTLFRDVLTGHAAQRSGSLAVTPRGHLVHSLALQKVEGYPHYSLKDAWSSAGDLWRLLAWIPLSHLLSVPFGSISWWHTWVFLSAN